MSKKKQSFLLDLTQDDPFSNLSPIEAPLPGDVTETEETIISESEVIEEEEAEVSTEELDQENQEEEAEESDEEESEESEEENHEEEEENEESEEETEEIPITLLMAAQLKKDGILSDDFEVTEDTTPLEVYEQYKEAHYNALYNEVSASIYSEMQQRGFTEQHLVRAMASAQGATKEELTQSWTHEKFASLPDDAPQEEMKSAIRHMHLSRGLRKSEADKLIRTAEVDDELVDEFKVAKKFHKDKDTEFKNKTIKQQQELEQAQTAERNRVMERVNTILQNKKVLGVDLSPAEVREIRDGLFKNDTPVEIQNQQYNTTEFNKFLLEFNRDIETQILAFYGWKYKDLSESKLTQKAKNKFEEEFLERYKTVYNKPTTKSKKATNKKRKKPSSKTTQSEKPIPKTKVMHFNFGK